MSILDRYLIRQVFPPFFLALGIFTFVLAIQPTLDMAKLLLAKGVTLPTVAVLLLTVLPAALSLTIPIAFLVAVLMMLGRVSADRESVAILACGISPWRLLRPLVILGTFMAGLAMLMIMWATPESNQAYRRVLFKQITQVTATEIKPRVFFTKFPGKVMYIGDISPDGRWHQVLMADTSDPARATVTLAESGLLEIDQPRQLVRIRLDQATRYEPGRSDPRLYTVSKQAEPISISVSAEAVFGSHNVPPGIREMTYTQLEAAIANQKAQGKPAHAEIIQQQQMFSFPVACLIFSVVGLALGLTTRKEGRLAGMTLGLAVVLVYYSIMALAEGWTKGLARHPESGAVDVAATWARWIPNIVLGVVGLIALRRHMHPPTGRDWAIRLPAWLPRRRSAQTAPAGAGTARDVQRPVIVLRVPRTGLPTPRLLDRYVTMRFLALLSLGFMGLLALFYIGTFVDFADKLFKEQTSYAMFANYLIQRTPEFVVFVIPIAVLIAVLGTIGGLTQSNELIVMRACGVSLYRTALPLLAFALAGSVVLFAIDERILGEANRTAAQLKDTMIDRKPPPPSVTIATNQWMVGEDGRIYSYDAFGFDTNPGNAPTLHSVSVLETVGRPYRLTSHLHAARARFDGQAWTAEHGWLERFDKDAAIRTDFERQIVPLPPVGDFRRTEIDPSTMTFVEYRDYVKRLGASGLSVSEQQVNLQKKIAFPMVTIIMTLLGVPFGVTIGKKGALYGIGLAVMIAGGYFLLTTFFMAVGTATLLPPALAAWGANIIFGAGAAYMLLTVRT